MFADFRRSFRSNFWIWLIVTSALTFFGCSAHSCGEKETTVRLAYLCVEPEVVPEGDLTPVIMLHGLTDIKETWDGLYQPIVNLTNRKVCMYDARNHGESSWNDTMEVESIVSDLEDFMENMNIDKAILVGHSMGGLTAIILAHTRPHKVEAIFVEDMAPVMPRTVYPFVRYWIRGLIRSLSSVPEDADEETAKEAILRYVGEFFFKPMDEPTLASFVNFLPIHFCDGTWQWKGNLHLINKYAKTTTIDYPYGNHEFNGKAVFVYGENSPFKVGQQEKIIRKLFPNAKMVGIKKGSHILHDSHPEFQEELLNFCRAS